MSKSSWTRGGGRIFLLPQRKRDGIDSKDGERVCDIASVVVVTRQDPSGTVDAKARIPPCQ